MTAADQQPGHCDGTMLVDGTFQLNDGTVDTDATDNFGLTSTGTFRLVAGDFNANASTVTFGNDFYTVG